MGLAGPIYGLGAALASLAVFYLTGNGMWAAIAHFGVVINVFNLVPVWQLDGARGVHAMTRGQRGILLLVSMMAGLLTGEKMMFLVALGLGYRLFTKDWAATPDRRGLVQFVGLILAFGLVAVLSDRVK